jgi:hypothetical protein
MILAGVREEVKRPIKEPNYRLEYVISGSEIEVCAQKAGVGKIFEIDDAWHLGLVSGHTLVSIFASI